jgi:hypothetical protein
MTKLENHIADADRIQSDTNRTLEMNLPVEPTSDWDCKVWRREGIRTLDTGFSSYNGLANESFSLPSLVFNSLRLDRYALDRVQGLSFGICCAPFCAPSVEDRLRLAARQNFRCPSNAASGMLMDGSARHALTHLDLFSELHHQPKAAAVGLPVRETRCRSRHNSARDRSIELYSAVYPDWK